MKNNRFQFLFISFAVILACSQFSLAQSRGSPSTAAKSSSSSGSNTKVRFLAKYEYSMISPKDLNDFRSVTTFGGTTRTLGTFNAMNGFNIGAGYLLGPGYLGVEYNASNQELQSTTITPTSATVQDTVQFQSVYLTYDWVKSINANSSYEFGAGLGYALKYEFHWVITNGGTDDVIWKANPVVAKLRAAYNYHFSNNVKATIGAGYEYATSSNMTADANHAAVAVTSGQILRYASGQDVKVDLSGFRLNVGLILGF
ncbi:hypothetical protein K2P97_02570 [bacterium]|nr:hypothetical protein [bacterium]